MPYKVWAVNEILTAADMNTYVGNQTILSFAGTAARATAIATPVEGMLSYVGSGVVEVYAGTATGWAEISGGGGVTVGTAAPSTPDEGDLWLNSTEAKMYVYYDDGTSAQWVAAVGGTVPSQGKIIAVKDALFTGTQTASVASQGNVAVTDLSITHEVANASNKLIISAFLGIAATSETQGQVGLAIHDGTSLIAIGDTAGNRNRTTAGGLVDFAGGNLVVTMPSVTFVHTPGAGSKTYTVRALNLRDATKTLYINRSQLDTDVIDSPRGVSSIVIQEVAV